MMLSEFIDRTGFEPTAEEYRDIEAEYMGCDVHKDIFCKQWVKHGGIQRLSRMRVRRIEELEQKLATVQVWADKREVELCTQCNEVNSRLKETIAERDRVTATLEAIRNLL